MVRITLLTQDACAYCDQAKDVLDRLGVEFELGVETVDLQSPEGRTLADRGDVMFAPGVLIDDEPFSYGRPSERRLRRELEQRLRSARNR